MKCMLKQKYIRKANSLIKNKFVAIIQKRWNGNDVKSNQAWIDAPPSRLRVS